MSKIKILYVEDEPYLAKIVKESLESRNFDVLMVHDGGRALTAFEQYQADICVLDVMLPTKDGFEVGQEIRALDPLIPIIYLTARTQTQDVLKGFQSGGNDYLKKPFSLEELIVRIQNLIKLTQGQEINPDSMNEVKIGRYTFFPKKYELCLDEHAQKLSHRETQLLQIFINHRNQAVERKFILKEVWGDDSFFNSRNLDVYIKKLRNYLKEDSKVQIITLKGVGYHFLAEG